MTTLTKHLHARCKIKSTCKVEMSLNHSSLILAIKNDEVNGLQAYVFNFAPTSARIINMQSLQR